MSLSLHQTHVGVAAASPEQQPAAERLAAALSLPCCDRAQVGAGFLLLQEPDRLVLQQVGADAPGPVVVDFVAGRAAHRRKFGGGRGQPLARAIGLKQGRSPQVLDLTAGLGRDAFVLATLGCEVTLIERSPVIHALLADGLRRAALDLETAPIIARMQLRHREGRDYAAQLTPAAAPDSIYLDPMYPQREKSARVKKEMRLFQLLLGDEEDGGALLETALPLARDRVVVKRPAKAPPLAGHKPAFSISSPNTRYDVYLTASRHAV